ncbi:plasmid partitioning protein RepB C-terminal domain-containing protein [Roseicyclus sp.]|uniref:plasmid partitioning protein RepB C-terminal domain-containing protein n=1 Tax=Roseicyclus sp. TaxID=1914329 RepID=UPI001BD08B7F
MSLGSRGKDRAGARRNPRSIIAQGQSSLDGICEEAVSILKDKHCATAVFETLRKMKAMRQIEDGRTDDERKQLFSKCISAILAGTPQAQLVDTKPKKMRHHPRGHGPHGARAGPAAGELSLRSKTPTAKTTCS